MGDISLAGYIVPHLRLVKMESPACEISHHTILWQVLYTPDFHFMMNVGLVSFAHKLHVHITLKLTKPPEATQFQPF